MCQRLNEYQLISPTRPGVVSHPFYRGHTEAPRDEAPRAGSLDWNAGRPVSESTLRTIKQHSHPRAERGTGHDLAEHVLFLPLPQGLGFCCALCLEGSSLTSSCLFKGHFLREALLDPFFKSNLSPTLPPSPLLLFFFFPRT